MAACRFGSPDLVTSLSGTTAAPTFAFDAANVNYFGVSGTFASSNGAVCSFPTRSLALGRTSTYAITPINVTTSGASAKTTSCSVLAPASIIASSGGSTTYTGIDCPSIIDNKIAAGTYTLRFSQPVVVGVPSVASQVFVVASPTVVTDSVTASVLQTITASVEAASTIVVTTYLSTVTETASAPISTIIATGDCSTAISSILSSTTSTVPASSIPISSTSSAPQSTPTKISTNGACGPLTSQTCLNSTFGPCCSAYNFCGSTETYCSTTQGCQPLFGSCTPPSTNISTDGKCGGSNKFVCPGSGFGDCCSAYGYCGSTSTHCGAGCQLIYGTCNGTGTPTGTAPVPSSTLKTSLDGVCGGTSGQTCLGSDFGGCCSQYGFCGSTSTYCSAGCQAAFGTCRSAAKRKFEEGRFLKNAEMRLEKRAGGAGPDYTYPPIPYTTVTAGATQIVNVTPSGGVQTSTVLGIATTTVASGGVVTVTEVVCS